MFAPNHHPAMKHAAPVRKELGMRTILNILGPLTNPAGAPNQVMGVFHQDLVGIQARVLKMLGSRHVLTVHGTVAVAASTLAAAALFTPLRRRVQHAVDRRFNRARYDADQTIAAFATHLKDAVDLDSVRTDLTAVVHRALEPAHVSL